MFGEELLLLMHAIRESNDSHIASPILLKYENRNNKLRCIFIDESPPSKEATDYFTALSSQSLKYLDAKQRRGYIFAFVSK